MTTALVLAGTRPGGDPFAGQMGVPHKGLIELEGQPLLERVVAALRKADIERIAVSCNDPDLVRLSQSLGVEVIDPGPGPSASVAAAFDRYGAPLLVTTSDHALLDPQWVREIIVQTPAAADLSVMLAERTEVERAMPGSKRTFLRFADGHWSGCNLFYLQRPEARHAIQTWSLVEQDRKRPWRIAARLGARTLLSMVFGRLTLQEGLQRLGERVGVAAHLVRASNGLAAVDIDKQADLEAVRALLAGLKSGTSARRD